MARFRLRPRPWILGGTGHASVSGSLQVWTIKALGSVLLGGTGRSFVSTSQIAPVSGVPTWSAAPVFYVTEGVSVTYPLPVSVENNPTANINVMWVGPGSQPAWIGLNSGTAPSITFTGAQVNANDLTGVVISATANGTTVNSQAGSIIVNVLPTAGTWTNLTFPPILRKYPLNAPSASGAFDPTYALNVDAMTPTRTNVVPFRAFSRPIQGEPGIWYWWGGIHSNYPGNETDRIDLRNLVSTTVDNAINHQPRVPPNGPNSGYASGQGGYVYRMYDDPALPGANDGLADPTFWQPYTVHEWTRNTWHPDHGVLYSAPYAVPGQVGANPNGDGTNYQLSSSLVYGDSRTNGLISYNWAINKYSLVFAPTAVQNQLRFLSDFDPYRQSVFNFDVKDGHAPQVWEWAAASHAEVWGSFGGPVSGYVQRDSINGDALLPPNGFAQSPNGWTMKWLQMGDNAKSEFLLIGVDTSANVSQNPPDTTGKRTVILKYVPGSGFTRIPLPSHVDTLLTPYVNGDGQIAFCVDRQGHRVFWVAFVGPVVSGMIQGQPKVYVSNIEDLTTWTEVALTSVPTITINMGYIPDPLTFHNGHLFIMWGADGMGTHIHRVKVDAAAEDLPLITFNRHHQLTQNFNFPGGSSFPRSKHTNWAYNTADGKYHEIGGDVGESYTQSMAKLTISPSSYTFEVVLDELTPAPIGYVRPGSPDDGVWQYFGQANANPTYAGKFLFSRGGDGIGVRGSLAMQGAYASDAAAFADRWTISRLLTFDPVNKRFTDLQMDTWPLNRGTVSYPDHPANLSSASHRCGGVLDPTTNKFYKFSPDWLYCYDLNAQTIRVWSIAGTTIGARSVRVDNSFPFNPPVEVYQNVPMFWNPSGNNGQGGWYTNFEGEWEHQAVWLDERDGKLYVVSGATGVLWCFETRGVETQGDGGSGTYYLKIPFYPVGERVPKDFQYHWSWPKQADARMNSLLMPFKGGLLYMCNHRGGANGLARYAYWRRLGNTGAWSVVTLPKEWAANAMAPKTRSIDNAEILAIGSGGGAGCNSPYFHLIT